MNRRTFIACLLSAAAAPKQASPEPIASWTAVYRVKIHAWEVYIAGSNPRQSIFITDEFIEQYGPYHPLPMLIENAITAARTF